MTLALQRLDNPLRPTYEGIAAVCWTVAAVLMFGIVMVTSLPRSAMAIMGLISIMMASWRWRQAFKRWDYKIDLVGKPFAYLRAMMLVRLMKAKPDDLWLGFGFNWSRIHAQRAVEMRKHDEEDVLPPMWFRKLRGAEKLLQPVGKAWIHAIGGKEEQVYVPLTSIEGHNIVFGTTGSGKTRLFELLITQAVLRGEVVIVIDPKGDKELRDIMQRACILAKRPNAFIEFRPAFPQTSIRIDPLANWSNVTEVASRIAALMPSEGGGDSFVQMAWKAVHVVAEGLVYIEQRPTLMKLRRCIEGGAEKLMEEVLRTFFTRHVPRWETLVSPIIQRARDGKLPTKLQGSAELLGYIHFYKNEIAEGQREPAIDGLLAMVEHNREHLGKILASLVPLLVQLTAGEIGKMLSPDPTDLNDPRPIFNSAKVIEGGHALYLGLDSLSNATVGTALGSIMLADLAAVAGARYNYESSPRKIQLFVDEANEVANAPLVQILNKARGAGFVATLATQTLPDFIARLGDEAKARQVLGNCNNLIALRTIDRQTQEFIVETFGTTRIQTISRSLGLGSETESTGIDYRTTATQSVGEEEVDMFAPELLGMLQNLHYVAKLAGGRVVKGRLPKLTYGEA